MSDQVDQARSVIRQTMDRVRRLQESFAQDFDLDGALPGATAEELEALEEAAEAPPPEPGSSRPEAWWAPLMKRPDWKAAPGRKRWRSR